MSLVSDCRVGGSYEQLDMCKLMTCTVRNFQGLKKTKDLISAAKMKTPRTDLRAPIAQPDSRIFVYENAVVVGVKEPGVPFWPVA
jgi:hypothetical protein